MANVDSIDYIWVALATVMALPGVMFIGYTTVPRRRFLCMLGALVGGVAGAFVTLFFWGSALNSIPTVGAVVIAGTFFIANVTGLIGILLVSFLLGGSPSPRSTQVEF